MAFVHARQRWKRRPTGPVEIDWNNPLTKGLQVFLDMRPTSYHLNLVNRKALNPSTNTLTFNQAGLVTNGSVSTVTYSDIGVAAAAPCTFVYSNRHISGTVDWSLGSASWNGYYATGNTGDLFNIAVNVTFPGVIGPFSPTGVPNEHGLTRWGVAVRGANDVIGLAGPGANFGTDTSTTIPAGAISTLRLGADMDNSNPAVSYLEFWGYIGRALTPDELHEWTTAPWQVAKPLQRRMYVNTAGGGGGGTFKPFWAVQNNSVIGVGVH